MADVSEADPFPGALSAFLIALARPQLGFVEQDFMQRGRDVVLAIDTSKSMSSTDYAPDRLTRAKLAAQDIMNAMKGDRFGLVAFAGAAQVEAPLTIDYQSVVDAINQLDTKSVERCRKDAGISSSFWPTGTGSQSSKMTPTANCVTKEITSPHWLCSIAKT